MLKLPFAVVPGYDDDGLIPNINWKVEEGYIAECAPTRIHTQHGTFEVEILVDRWWACEVEEALQEEPFFVLAEGWGEDDVNKIVAMGLNPWDLAAEAIYANTYEWNI